MSLSTLFSACPMWMSPFAYGGPSCKINILLNFPSLSGFSIFHLYNSLVVCGKSFSLISFRFDRLAKSHLGRCTVREYLWVISANLPAAVLFFILLSQKSLPGLTLVCRAALFIAALVSFTRNIAIFSPGYSCSIC